MQFELSERLPDDYADLFFRSAATAFQHPSWVAAFVEHLAPGRAAMVLFAIARREGRLTAAVALTIRRVNGLRLLEPFDLGVCDYVAPVVDRESCDVECAHGLAQVLPPHDLLRVSNVRPEHERFWAAFTDDCHEPAGFSAHAVELEGGFETWRAASIERSLASQTRRKARRWMRDANVEIKRVPSAGARAAVRELAALRSGRFEGDPIQGSATLQFYSAVAASEDFCETWRLSADGETAGLLLGVVHRGTFHYLLIGCDYGRFGKHSPGQILYEYVIEDWMARGGTSFDFTIGDEAFKQRYGTKPTPMVRFCTARTLPGRLGRMVLERRKTMA